jgi:nucleoside phosphorylase
VVVGVAGALVRGFEAGDLVVASALGVADAAVGSGLEVKEPPRPLDDRSSELGERLLRALSSRYGSTTSAPLVSAVRSARGGEREQLARSGAVVCDTESAWLAQLAGTRSFAVVRSIVDTPERELLSLGTLRGGLRALSRLVGVSEVIAEVLSG